MCVCVESIEIVARKFICLEQQQKRTGWEGGGGVSISERSFLRSMLFVDVIHYVNGTLIWSFHSVLWL